MHGVEPGEQPPDEARPLPRRQRAVELADGGGRGLEHIEDVLDGGKTRHRRAEAPPALGVEFVDAGVQGKGSLLSTMITIYNKRRFTLKARIGRSAQAE